MADTDYGKASESLLTRRWAKTLYQEEREAAGGAEKKPEGGHLSPDPAPLSAAAASAPHRRRRHVSRMA